MYRKSLFDEIGLFDEDFFAYADDARSEFGHDWQAGNVSMFPQPSSIIKTLEQQGNILRFKAFYVERNRFWITIKYFPLSLLLLASFFTIWRFAFQAYGALSHRGAAGKFTQMHSPWRLIGILFKAYGSGLRGLPKMWKKRRRLRRLRKVSFGEIFSWFKRFGISAKEISLRD